MIHKERIGSIGEVACHVDDASTGHTGCKKVKGEVTEKFLPNFVGDTRVLDAKEYKKEVLNMESISIPPGFTSFRPNDQPQINGLLSDNVCNVRALPRYSDNSLWHCSIRALPKIW